MSSREATPPLRPAGQVAEVSGKEVGKVRGGLRWEWSLSTDTS
jgi:hypothetical protein